MEYKYKCENCLTDNNTGYRFFTGDKVSISDKNGKMAEGTITKISSRGVYINLYIVVGGYCKVNNIYFRADEILEIELI